MRNSRDIMNLTLSKHGWHKKRGVGYPMKKRFLALTIAVLMALCVIPFAASADDAEVTIRVGGWPEEATDPVSYAAYAGYLEKMNELYPNITVIQDSYSFDLQTYLPLAASGQLPTFYGVHFTECQKLINNGYAGDITDTMAQYGYDKFLSPDALKLVEKDGRYYGLPTAYYANGIAYNVALFEKAGLINEDGTAKIPATWEELAEFAAKIKETSGVPGFQFYSKDNMGGWMFTNLAWCFGAANLEIMAEDGTYTAAVNSEGAVAAMQYLKDLRWKYNVLPDTLIASRTEGMQWMSVDQLGMMITPPDVFGNMCRTYGIAATNLGEFSIPSGPDGSHAVLTGGSANMFNPDATPEEVDAAFKWLAVTGYTPECTDEVKTALEENVKAQLADGNVVSNLNMSVWVGGEKREAEIAIREKYQNIDPTKMTDYMENGSKDLHPEEPVEVQALYAMLDSVIQEVFTNENADVQALLDSVNADFQAQYLDPYNDTLK